MTDKDPILDQMTAAQFVRFFEHRLYEVQAFRDRLTSGQETLTQPNDDSYRSIEEVTERVDWMYRSLEEVKAVAADAAGLGRLWMFSSWARDKRRPNEPGASSVADRLGALFVEDASRQFIAEQCEANSVNREYSAAGGCLYRFADGSAIVVLQDGGTWEIWR